MWGRSTLTADSLVDDGIGIARFSRVLQPHCITNFIYLRQGIVQLFFGVGGREAEPDASLHQGRRRKAHSNHCDILRGQSSNDGTAKHSQKITQNFQSDFFYDHEILEILYKISKVSMKYWKFSFFEVFIF